MTGEYTISEFSENNQPSVQIVSNSRGAYTNKVLVGKPGRLTGSAENRNTGIFLYRVVVEGERNPFSKDGGFWFPMQDLEFLDEETTIKEEKAMLPGYQTAAVQFVDGVNREKTYFYALYDPTIVPGDMVVVSTGHHGLALAQVSYIGGPSTYVTNNREIVCRVDLSAWEERKELAKTMQQLKAEMDERVKQYQAMALYELAAEKDPGLKELLDRFKTLQGGLNNA